MPSVNNSGRKRLTTIQKALALGLVSLFACVSARAQTPLSFAPWEFSVNGNHLDGSDSNWIVLQGQRRVPLPSLLPQVSPDSKIEVMRLAVGARTAPETDPRFIYRVTALELLLHRSFFSGGTKLLDINRAGLLEMDTDWIQIATGPGMHRQNDEMAFSLRILLVGAYSTWKYGNHLDATSSFNSTHSGFKYGLQGMFSISPAPRITLLGSYHSFGLSSSNDAGTHGGRLELRSSVTERFSVSALALKMDLETVDRDSGFTSYGLSVRMSSSNPDL